MTAWRSRRRMASRGASFMRTKAASIDDPVLGKIQLAEMAIAVAQFDQHGFLGLGPAPAHFGQAEFKAIGAVDADAVFRAGDGIEDGLAARLQIAGNIDLGAAAVDVDLEGDVR